jgi:hypothetical protein
MQSRKIHKFLEELNSIVPGISGAVFMGSYDDKTRVIRVHCKRRGKTLSKMSILPSALASKRSKVDMCRFAETVAGRLRESALRKLEAREIETGLKRRKT